MISKIIRLYFVVARALLYCFLYYCFQLIGFYLGSRLPFHTLDSLPHAEDNKEEYVSFASYLNLDKIWIWLVFRLKRMKDKNRFRKIVYLFIQTYRSDHLLSRRMQQNCMISGDSNKQFFLFCRKRFLFVKNI